MTDDDALEAPDSGDAPLPAGLDLDEESLRPFIITLATFVGMVAVATLVALLSHPLGKKFARRHPLLAEVLNVGRR